MKLRLVLAAVLFCGIGRPEPVHRNFRLWNTAQGEDEKIALYLGWVNGLWGRGPEGSGAERAQVDGFFECLEALSYKQVVAMVNKYYRDHPERWNRLFHEQMLLALTVSGGTCKNPWPIPAADPGPNQN